MNLIFFTHPDFVSHQSMPRFARMLAQGMSSRGHNVEFWSPKAGLVNITKRPFLRKWLGYIDQYIAFPRHVSRLLKSRKPEETLFVFTDQALGPWVPLVADRPHVIHCHDFMALQSALGEIPENPIGWTGKLYQTMIRKGFSRGRNFLSVSNKTKRDLHKYLLSPPSLSEVVYNGLHHPYSRVPRDAARTAFGQTAGIDLRNGYILHVGGNIWYKNRVGVLEIYDAWRKISDIKLPLIMIGEAPSPEISQIADASKYCWDIHWLSQVSDKMLQQAYSGASLFLFPSIGEGFGWPIAEAMASGAPVITTDEPPMSEVSGRAGFSIPRRPRIPGEADKWAHHAAVVVDEVLNLAPDELEKVIQEGLDNAKRFDTDRALDQIENHYKHLLDIAHPKSKVA